MKELQRQASPNIVIALAGNKADLASKRMVDFEVSVYSLWIGAVGINWNMHIARTKNFHCTMCAQNIIQSTQSCMFTVLHVCISSQCI